jgi:alkylation response protein AidB-like acyl-CoA dehydrogenase
MSEAEQLAAAFERMGATQAQAATMAAQLLKRAAQIAGERGITREAALARLLELATKGRAGELPADYTPPPPPARPLA